MATCNLWRGTLWFSKAQQKWSKVVLVRDYWWKTKLQWGSAGHVRQAGCLNGLVSRGGARESPEIKCAFVSWWVFVHVSVSSASPEECRLRAAGDHEEAAGETGSQHLWFRGGVFRWRRRPLSSTQLLPFLPPSLFPPSAVPFPFFKPQPAALSILRRRPTARSSWRSCGVDKNSSARLHRNRNRPPTGLPTHTIFCHVCLEFTWTLWGLV